MKSFQSIGKKNKKKKKLTMKSLVSDLKQRNKKHGLRGLMQNLKDMNIRTEGDLRFVQE